MSDDPDGVPDGTYAMNNVYETGADKTSTLATTSNPLSDVNASFENAVKRQKVSCNKVQAAAHTLNK